VVCKQLRFYAMNARRLLQSLNHVGEQASLNVVGLREPFAVRDKQVSDHAFAAFVNEESITKDLAALDGGIARKDLGIHITQDHIRRTVVVPGKQTRPDVGFIVQQGAKVGRSEVPEVEDLHGAPEALSPQWLGGAKVQSSASRR